jgi:hypothetical protein
MPNFFNYSRDTSGTYLFCLLTLPALPALLILSTLPALSILFTLPALPVLTQPICHVYLAYPAYSLHPVLSVCPVLSCLFCLPCPSCLPYPSCLPCPSCLSCLALSILPRCISLLKGESLFLNYSPPLRSRTRAVGEILMGFGASRVQSWRLLSIELSQSERPFRFQVNYFPLLTIHYNIFSSIC